MAAIVSALMRSMMWITRIDWPMVWMYWTKNATDTSTRANDTATATPGTNWFGPPSPPRTFRSTSRAKTKVARNTPRVTWLRGSRKNVRSTRGENWLLASCRTTIVTEKTSAVRVRVDEAMEESNSLALSGPPLKPTRRPLAARCSSSSSKPTASPPARTTVPVGRNQYPARRRAPRRRVLLRDPPTTPGEVTKSVAAASDSAPLLAPPS